MVAKMIGVKRMGVLALATVVIVALMLILPMPWSLTPLAAEMLVLCVVLRQLNRTSRTDLDAVEKEETAEESVDPEWVPYLQTPIVDALLRRYYQEEHMPYGKRPEVECTKAWSEHGFREMVTFLHQSLDIPCKIKTVQTFCRPAFLLGWLYGALRLNAVVKGFEKRIKDLVAQFRQEAALIENGYEAELFRLQSEVERERERYKSFEPDIQAVREALEEEQAAHAMTKERLEEELSAVRMGASASRATQERLKQQVEELSQNVEELKQKNQQLVIQLAQTPMSPPAPPKFSTTKERNAAILQYIADGHKQPEAAEYFGLKANLVKQIVYQANKGKADEEDVAEEEAVNE